MTGLHISNLSEHNLTALCYNEKCGYTGHVPSEGYAYYMAPLLDDERRHAYMGMDTACFNKCFFINVSAGSDQTHTSGYTIYA